MRPVYAWTGVVIAFLMLAVWAMVDPTNYVENPCPNAQRAEAKPFDELKFEALMQQSNSCDTCSRSHT